MAAVQAIPQVFPGGLSTKVQNLSNYSILGLKLATKVNKHPHDDHNIITVLHGMVKAVLVDNTLIMSELFIIHERTAEKCAFQTSVICQVTLF